METATLADTARPTQSSSTSTKPRRRQRRLLWIGLWLLIAAAGIGGAQHWLYPPPEPPPEPRSLPPRVSALGRLAPESEVISVAPPTPTGAMSGARVDELMVAVGDYVKAGQVVAVLDTYRGRAVALRQSQAMIAVSRAKVALIRAGPKLEDVKAQEAAIRRAEADLVSAQEDYERASRLVGSNAIAREDYSARRSKYEQSRASLAQEKAKLEALRMIRPVDVEGAEAELAQMEAAFLISQEDARNTEVRSPISGQVLRIRARAGERIGDQGILDVGNTSVMQVVTEVYEADIGKVRIGQNAQVRVPTLGTEVWLSGTVVSKNLVIARQDIFNNDPVADIDSRVVEVRVRLSTQDGAKVAGLSHARAEVVIDVSGGAQ